jgi:hypothetical protein
MSILSFHLGAFQNYSNDDLAVILDHLFTKRKQRKGSLQAMETIRPMVGQ